MGMSAKLKSLLDQEANMQVASEIQHGLDVVDQKTCMDSKDRRNDKEARMDDNTLPLGNVLSDVERREAEEELTVQKFTDLQLESVPLGNLVSTPADDDDNTEKQPETVTNDQQLSSGSPSPATPGSQSSESASHVAIEKKPEDDNNKDNPSSTVTHLCFCVHDYTGNPMVYSIRFIKLSELFAKPKHEDATSLFSKDFIESKEEFSKGCGYGMVAGVNGRFYVYSGLDRYIKEYFIGDLLERNETRPWRKYGLEHTPKITPIVVKIKECIYVLSHPLTNHWQANPSAFAVYDFVKKDWEPLDAPPCMLVPNPYVMSPITAYLVYGKYLCVSTKYLSFAFDTETKKWGGCLLFRKDKTDASDIPDGQTNVFRMNPPNGPPFPFSMAAFMYNDFLLCTMNKSAYDILSYKVRNGRVLNHIPVKVMDGGRKRNDHGYWNMLVDLGGGGFCLASRERDYLYFTKIEIALYGEGLTWKPEEFKVSLVYWPDEVFLTKAFYQTIAV